MIGNEAIKRRVEQLIPKTIRDYSADRFVQAILLAGLSATPSQGGGNSGGLITWDQIQGKPSNIVTGTGTEGTLPKFGTASGIVNSIVREENGTIIINGPVYAHNFIKNGTGGTGGTPGGGGGTGGTGVISWENILNKPDGFASDWSLLSNKPDTAVRWPTWFEVTDKPTAFAPTAHTHSLSEINGLQDALNLKLNTSLTSARVFVGSSTNIATERALSLNATGGTFALSNTGVFTFPNANTNTRGLLVAADWNTFNSKIGGSGTTGTVALFTAAGTIGNSRITQTATQVIIEGDLVVNGLSYSHNFIKNGTGGTGGTPGGGGGTGVVTWENILDRPSTFPTDWSIVSNRPDTATRWPTWTEVTGKPTEFTPAAHSHGNITNSGAIGTVAGLPIITTASGLLTTGSFGTAAGTFAQGNDTRIVNAVQTSRTLTAGTGLTGGGNLTADRTFELTGQALALHNLSINGFIVRTSAGAVTARSFAGGNGINITNENGINGNPSISLDTAFSDNRYVRHDIASQGLNTTQQGNARTNIGALGGAGTAGQVSFWNGTTSLTGDTGLLWDNTPKFLTIRNLSGALDTETVGLSILANSSAYLQINVIPRASAASEVRYSAVSGGSISGGMSHIFLTRHAYGAVTEKFRIASDGNVGIGVTNPTSILEVNGDIQLQSNYLRVRNTVGTSLRITGIDSANNVYFGVDGNQATLFRTNFIERMRIAANGNVGIGTANPNVRLVGGVALSLNNTVQSGLELLVNGVSAGEIFTNSGGLVVNEFRNLPMMFRTNNIERIRLLPNGNLLIGTATELTGGGTLQIKQGATLQGIHLEANSGGYAAIDIRSDRTGSLNIGGFRAFQGTQTFARAEINITADSNIIFANGNGTSGIVERMRVNAAGNIVATGTVTATNFIKTSDKRLKMNEQPIHNWRGAFTQIRGLRYVKNGERELGFFAQEVEFYFPELISKDSKGYLAMDYNGMIPVLWEAMREEMDETEKLKRRITDLESQVEKLKNAA